MTPAGGLRLFLDRSTNSKQFAAGLREAGCDVVTIGERYGVAAAQDVKDTQWLSDASDDGRICVGADKAILSNQIELAAVLAYRARYVVFSNNNVTGRQQLALMVAVLDGVRTLAGREGPWVAVAGRGGLMETPVEKLHARLGKLQA